MVDAPERIWTMVSGRYAFDEPHMRDGVAATEYVRVDLLTGPCGYLHMPIGLAEDSWSLEFDPSEYPDEVASAPLYMIDPTLSDAVADREAEPVDATDAERLSRLLGPSVDGQVVVAVLEDGDYADQPEWLWRNHTTGVCGFGRWSKAVGQSPYIRADIALAALAASPPTSELEALRKRVAELEKALEPFADIADLIDAETEGMSETDELELHFHDYLMASWPVAMFRTARRVREGGKVE